MKSTGNERQKSRKRGLITGASSGIGAAFAERLAREQYDLILVARRGDRLTEIGEKLTTGYGIAVDTIRADISKPEQLRSVEDRISAEPNLEILVNNAGFGAYQPFITLDADRAEELIRVQVTAVTRLTRAALPQMINRHSGIIINVSSRLGFSGSFSAPSLPKRATYAATKSFVNTFTQILHTELAGTGVKVQALCPAVVRTEFHERMGMDTSRIPASMVMSPDEVVRASMAALKTDETICIPTLEDEHLVDKVHESEFTLWEQSGGNTIAKRYQE